MTPIARTMADPAAHATPTTPPSVILAGEKECLHSPCRRVAPDAFAVRGELVEDAARKIVRVWMIGGHQ